MASVSTLVVALTAQTTDFERGLKSIEKSLDRTAARFADVGGSMTAALTAPLAALATAAVKLATDFDAPFERMHAVLGQSAGETNQLKESVLRLAGETAQAPKDLGAALGEIEGAGIRGQQALNVLRASAEASAIGLGDLRTMASFLSAELNAYGPAALSAGKATSVLIEAARVGRINIDQLLGSLDGLLPIAAQAGVSFDQMTAAVTAMTRAGLSAQEASAGLRTVLTTLEKPSTSVQNSLAMVGLSAAGLRQQLSSQGLLSVLQTLKAAFQGQDQALAQMFPNARTFAAVMSLIGANSGQTAAIFQRLGATTEATLGQAFRKWAQTDGAQFARAMEQVQAALIRLGEDLLPVVVPMVERFTRAVQDLSSWFEHLDAGSKNLAIALAAIAAGIGPTLLAFAGLYSAAATVVSAFRLIIGMTGIANLFSAAAVGVRLLAAGMAELAGYFAAFGVAETIADVILPALAGSALLAGGLAAAAAYLWITKWTELKTDLGIIVDWIKDKFNELTGALGRVADGLFFMLTPVRLLGTAFSYVAAPLSAGIGKAAEAAQTAGASIRSGVMTELTALEAQAGAVFSGIVGKAKGLATGLVGAAQGLGGATGAPGGGAAESAFPSGYGFVGPKVSDAGVMTQVAATMKQQGSVVDATMNSLKANALEAANSFRNSVHSMVSATEQSMGAMTAAFLQGKEGLGQYIQQMILAIGELIVKILLLKALTSAGLGGPFASGLVGGLSLGPGHAAGGQVSPGTAYPVGEAGPELFVPSTSGSIVPNNMLGGGGPVQVVVNQNLTMPGMDLGSQEAARRLATGLKELARSGAAEGVAAALQLTQTAQKNGGRAV